jgi:hypothetical protein
MLGILEEPYEQLQETIEILYRLKRHDPSYDSAQKAYLREHIEDIEMFEKSINEAMQSLKEADKYTKKGISATYPHYTPYEELTWVSKEVFEKNRGKLLEEDNAEYALIVKRYEYGEWYLYQDGSKYGIYSKYEIEE